MSGHDIDDGCFDGWGKRKGDRSELLCMRKCSIENIIWQER